MRDPEAARLSPTAEVLLIFLLGVLFLFAISALVIIPVTPP